MGALALRPRPALEGQTHSICCCQQLVDSVGIQAVVGGQKPGEGPRILALIGIPKTAADSIPLDSLLSSGFRPCLLCVPVNPVNLNELSSAGAPRGLTTSPQAKLPFEHHAPGGDALVGSPGGVGADLSLALATDSPTSAHVHFEGNPVVASAQPQLQGAAGLGWWAQPVCERSGPWCVGPS